MKKPLTITALLMLILFARITVAQYWHQITNIPAPYNRTYYLDVFFLDDGQHGWICGFNGHVIRTTDGGKSWRGTTVPGSYHLEQIQFTSNTFGYTSGVDGVFKSTDGGASWFKVSPDDSSYYWGCYFLDDNIGVTVGEGCAPPYKKKFWRTTDGGANWTSFIVSDGYPTGLTDVEIYEQDGEGYAVSSGWIWKTEDGGRSWDYFVQTGTVVWHEELCKSGLSFLVPYAGDDCSGGNFDGGMRFSDNDGTSWRNTRTGKPMFGAFLIDENKGWVCGDDAAVYYTSNAGRTWELRNCGINDTVNIDDIWFITPEKAWAVGGAVYMLDAENISATDDSIDFGRICIPYYETEYIWVKNNSFNDKNAHAELIDNNDGVFEITEPDPPDALLSQCDSLRVGIRYTPVNEVGSSATLRITTDVNDTIDIPVLGSAFQLTAKPLDTLIVIDSAMCGYQYKDTIRWTAEKAGEFISDIRYISGNKIIKLESPGFQQIDPVTGAVNAFSVIPTDTGWTEARYAVHIMPCDADVFITVKVYGVSPIINARADVNMDIGCSLFRLDSISVKNTGNYDLIIRKTELLDSTSGFSVLGWSGGSSTPDTIRPGESDTLLLKFQPSDNNRHKTYLILYHNDNTVIADTMRNPLYITLDGSILSTRLMPRDTTINFGNVCIGQSKTIGFYLKNTGNLDAGAFYEFDSSGYWKVESTVSDWPHQLAVSDSIPFYISFIPNRTGEFNDTVRFYDNKCGDSVIIPLRGYGLIAEINADPALITGTVQTPNTLQRKVKVYSLANMDLNITDISIQPDNPEWHLFVNPALPQLLKKGDSLEFTITLNSDIDTTLKSKLCIKAEGECTALACIDLDLRSHSNWIEISHNSVDFGFNRCYTSKEQDIVINNKGTETEKITSLAFSPDLSVFAITNMPAIPYDLAAGDSLILKVSYDVQDQGTFETELVMETENQFITNSYRIPVKAEYHTVITSPDINTADFGINEMCDNERIIPVTIYNKGEYPDTLDIIRQQNISGFSVQPVDIIYVDPGDSAVANVKITPADFSSTGAFAENFIFRSRVCSDEFTVTATADIIRPRLTITPDKLDFGDVWVGETSNKEITISNESGFDKKITDIQIKPDNVNFTHDLTVPKLLKPDDKVLVKVKFISPKMGSYNSELAITEESVCIDTTVIPLTANSPEEIYYAKLSIPDYTAKPNDNLDVLLQLTHDDKDFNHDLSVLDAEKIDFEINFDLWLFYPQKVLVRKNGDYVSIPFEINDDGIKGTIDKELASDLLRDNGDIMIIKGIALASVPDYTPFKISTFEPVLDKKLVLNKIDGSLTLTDFCKAVGLTKMRYIFNTTIYLSGQVLETGSLNLIINNNGSTGYEFTVRDITGSIVFRSHRPFTYDNGYLSLDLETLSNGFYTIGISSDSGQQWIGKFIIDR